MSMTPLYDVISTSFTVRAEVYVLHVVVVCIGIQRPHDQHMRVYNNIPVCCRRIIYPVIDTTIYRIYYNDSILVHYESHYYCTMVPLDFYRCSIR